MGSRRLGLDLRGRPGVAGTHGGSVVAAPGRAGGVGGIITRPHQGIASNLWTGPGALPVTVRLPTAGLLVDSPLHHCGYQHTAL